MSSTNYPGSERKHDKSTPVLDQFGKDLTKLAQQGKLDPVIGRSKETKRCCQILARRKKNNPILIGDPGVGKTNIAYGIAQHIANKTCPINLFNKRIISIEIGALVAGTIYRGQFEERLLKLVDEVKANGNIILFIDEIHTIVGTGSGSGSLDTSNILKPSLSDGSLQVIGASTLAEYREHFENDGALTRRFQTILIEPTTVDDTIKILDEIKEVYEKHHSVEYNQDAIESCVKLSDRYITDKVLPDKAIDLMDEAGASANQLTAESSDTIKEFEKVLEDLAVKKKHVLELQDYESAAEIRDRQKEVKDSIEAEHKRIAQEAKINKKVITREMIETIVTQMTGIPVQKMNSSDLHSLSELEQNISSRVIGQDEPIRKVVKAIKRARVGISSPNKPISFMFIGTSGIGKTLFCKTLAKEMFGSEDALIRVDMSEYAEKFNVSKLNGAPPGYVGYEKGGDLTEKIRRKPYSVILLDEVEKAHKDMFDILLQVLDDGHMTDSLGRKINFKNTIIIMTSNIGAKELQNFGTGVGFATQARQDNEKAAKEAVLMKELNKFFKPEFINRLNGVLSFNSLKKENMDKILELRLAELQERLGEMGYEVTFDKSSKDYLIEKGFDEKMGARPLARAIEQEVEDVITDKIIEGVIQVGSTVKVTKSKTKDELCVHINKIPKGQ
jgi:ATP-dependent Clp protease ATP-binding subunit ClpC